MAAAVKKKAAVAKGWTENAPAKDPSAREEKTARQGESPEKLREVGPSGEEDYRCRQGRRQPGPPPEPDALKSQWRHKGPGSA